MEGFKQKISGEIFEQKYCLNGEKSKEEVFEDVAADIALAEETPEKAEEWASKFSQVMLEGKFFPGGRILANSRIYTTMPYYNNCYTIDIEDSIDGIYKALHEDALISCTGGGVGFNCSKLRPRGTPISKGGESSGVVSFLKVFNESAKIIHTGGGRRSAHIAILNVDHPEIKNFITCKQGSENEALTQFNISVGITDKFMDAVKNDSDWELVFDGKVYEVVKAKEIYDMIVRNSYTHNEPGVFYLDTVQRYNNGYWAFNMDRVNPCFTGETIVATADGRNGVPIKELAEENKEFLVYSAKRTIHNKWEVEIKKAVAFKTGEKKVIKVKLSDGSFFKCTPNHLLGLSSGEWIEAKDSKGKIIEKFDSFSDNGIRHINSIQDFGCYLGQLLSVVSIENADAESVYDLTVEDNHNFYIITKTDDEQFLNSSGILVHNCGEITMPSYSVCDLGSLNLPAFVKNPFTENAVFDFAEFSKTVKIGVRFLDNVLDRTEYPLDRIKEMSLNWRRIGLGFTGLGDMFAMMGYKYGDDQSIMLSDSIGACLKQSSYRASLELAKEKGAFPECNSSLLSESNFIQENFVYEFIKKIENYGLRNVGLNTIAPTGTQSLTVGENCSSGIEPIFSLEYDRNIRTGSEEELRKERVYDKAWLDYIEYLGKAPEEIPDFFVTTMDIIPKEAIDIQAIFQKHIDHSISKTINIPPGTTFEEYKEIYQYAYDNGLKGTTSFNPEGSVKGVLEYSAKKENRISPPRPKEIDCEIHVRKMKGEEFTILIGLVDGLPYEVFATKTHQDLKNNKKGKIVKKKRGWYDLYMDDQLKIENLSEEFDKEYGDVTRMISLMLRHKDSSTPLQFIVEQMLKGKGFVSFNKIVARELKKFIDKNEKVLSEEKCPECGANLIYVEGCKSCSHMCGWSKCS